MRDNYDVCIYGVDGLHVHIGCETREMYHDVCIYGVDGLDVVIGCTS